MKYTIDEIRRIIFLRATSFRIEDSKYKGELTGEVAEIERLIPLNIAELSVDMEKRYRRVYEILKNDTSTGWWKCDVL